MNDVDVVKMLVTLGSIETSIKDVKEQLGKLPCAENTERLVRLEQSFSNGKEYSIEQKSDKFKVNTQKIATISLAIIAIGMLLNLYKAFFN